MLNLKKKEIIIITHEQYKSSSDPSESTFPLKTGSESSNPKMGGIEPRSSIETQSDVSALLISQ